MLARPGKSWAQKPIDRGRRKGNHSSCECFLIWLVIQLGTAARELLSVVSRELERSLEEDEWKMNCPVDSQKRFPAGAAHGDLLGCERVES